MIDRYLLRYFLAVVDAGNFSRAAQQVNVAQPTLSVGIAKLEEALGARLFERNSQRVRLTEAGVRLLGHARSIESEFNALEGRVSGATPGRLVRVGVLATIPTRMVAGFVAANRPDGDEIEIVEGAERDLQARLQRGRIDVALTLVRPGETRFASEVLFEEGYVAVTPRDHPLADADVVAGEALAGEVMMVRRQCEMLSETSRYFTERGVRPRFSFRGANDDRVLALVEAGFGITVTPESLAGEHVAAVRLAGFDHRRRIGLLFADPTLAVDNGPTVAALRALRP
jgi:DNA-binding transcriptional LysR family regulator